MPTNDWKAGFLYRIRCLPDGWEGLQYFDEPCPEWPGWSVWSYKKESKGLALVCVYFELRRVASLVVPLRAFRVLPFSRLESDAMKFLRKVAAAEGTKSVVVCEDARLWSLAHPALWEYLTEQQWEDGTARETAMLCVFVEEGMFKACLQDRALARSLWASGGSPDDVLADLEEILQSGDDSRWRAARQQGKGKSRK